MKIDKGIRTNHNLNRLVTLRAVLAVASVACFLLASGPVALCAVLALGSLMSFLLASDAVSFLLAAGAEGR